MTIRRDPGRFPEPNDDQRPLYGGRQNSDADPLDLAGNLDFGPRRAADERRGLIHLAGQVLTSPGALYRILVFVGALLSLVLVASGVFGLSIDVGPLHIGPGVSGQHDDRK